MRPVVKVVVAVFEGRNARSIIASLIARGYAVVPISEEGDLLLSDRLEQTGVPSPEEQMITRSLGRQLDRSIHLLGPVEQMVIRMRFGLSDKPPETLKQIGDRLQLSRERIRQIEARALSKLQNMHTAKALSGYLS